MQEEWIRHRLCLADNKASMTFKMASRALRLGMSQKIRREKRLSTASSKSCGRFVAPKTTTLSLLLLLEDLHHLDNLY